MTAGDRSVEVHGVRVFECDGAGAPLRNNRDLNDLISTVWERRAKIVLIPVERLGADFFRLKTGVAGEIVQKFGQYHLRVAIVGDIARYIDESTALRDFVRESNRGNQVWFVASREELDERLRRK